MPSISHQDLAITVSPNRVSLSFRFDALILAYEREIQLKNAIHSKIACKIEAGWRGQTFGVTYHHPEALVPVPGAPESFNALSIWSLMRPDDDPDSLFYPATHALISTENPLPVLSWVANLRKCGIIVNEVVAADSEEALDEFLRRFLCLPTQAAFDRFVSGLRDSPEITKSEFVKLLPLLHMASGGFRSASTLTGSGFWRDFVVVD